MAESKSFKPPPSVRAAAVRGLMLRRSQSSSNKAGLDTKQASAQGIGSGVQRASDLKSGAALSESTVRRMKAYFDRHASNYKLDAGKSPKEDKGYVAGLLWGGDAGRAWANSVVSKLDARRANHGSS
jgi:hypothetical protein